MTKPDQSNHLQERFRTEGFAHVPSLFSSTEMDALESEHAGPHGPGRGNHQKRGANGSQPSGLLPALRRDAGRLLKLLFTHTQCGNFRDVGPLPQERTSPSLSAKTGELISVL
jgi:hypothetical protein